MALARLAVALRVPRVVVASQVLKRVVRQGRRPAPRLVAVPLVVVRKRAAGSGATPSCGVSMNRLGFSTVAFGRNSKCWRRIGPRAPAPRVTAQVTGRMLQVATVLLAVVSPVMARVMARATGRTAA
jgi:hypothetical protein